MSIWLLLLAARPLLVTVDDLPIATSEIENRTQVTDGLLKALRKHRIHAVGLVTWRNVRGDTQLLERWLEAGHELGNHSYSHLDYTTTDPKTYRADVERARVKIGALLAKRKKKLRWFRFPFLREGNTRAKLDAMRAYLTETGQRNLPVTIDTQDWSFDRPWLRAPKERAEIGRRYQASLRLAVEHYTRLGDRVIGRETPQVLLLHANAVGTEQWDPLFTWLEGQGFRFASADEVMADPVFAEPHAFVGPRGFSLWDRIRVQRDDAKAKQEIAAMLKAQAADWTRGDLERFCSVYAEDATFVAPSGMTQGRQQILDRYRKKYDTKAKRGSLSLDVLETRLARGWEVSRTGDAVPSKIHGASTVLRWTIQLEGKAPATGLSLIVLRPDEERRWHITQDASM